MTTIQHASAKRLDLEQHCPYWPESLARDYLSQGYWGSRTFAEMLGEQARQRPEHIALVDGQWRLNYAELDRRTGLLAEGLRALGLRVGDVVVVQLPNQAAFVELVFALFRAGVIPVFALPAHREHELLQFCQQTEARAYFHMARHAGFDYAALGESLQRQVPSLTYLLRVDDADPRDAWRHLYGAVAHTASVDPASVACFQLSGGTTGTPKLIPRRHHEYLYNALASAARCQLDGHSRYLAVLPMAHNFPMSSPGFLGALCVGAIVVIARQPSPVECFALIRAEGVTHTALVPTLALLWMELAENVPPRLGSLRLLQVGGAPFAEEAARRVRGTLGCQLQQVFGMAEGMLSFTAPDDPDEIVCRSQGRPLSPADEVRLVDDQDREVAPGVVGNLLVRGPYTIRGYFRAMEQNRHSFTADGFYRTGDLARWDENGCLVVSGRQKDLINRGGEKISVDEVEGLLLSHPHIYDAAVVGVPDSFLGEKICAFVIPRDAKLEAASILHFLRERGLAQYKLPDQVDFLEDFPTTAVGKVSKKSLRENLRQRYLTDN